VHEQEAVRRLVKSPPELWAQCSDPTSLARHLSGFGEIKITRLEPESTVAWEGESARGTVTLEASGWGTRVRLTAAPPPPAGPAPAGEPLRADAAVAGEPLRADTAAAGEPHPLWILSSSTLAPLGLIGRIGSLRRPRREAGFTAKTEDPAELKHSQEAPVPENPSLVAELEAALDSLGQAHHRPYSRS
jgi:hypothetical protein